MPFISKLTLLFLFIFFFQFSSATKCYVCSGPDQCKSPIEKECPPTVTHCAIATSESYPYIGKDCGYDKREKKEIITEGCYNEDTHSEFGKVKLCICKGNLCNTEENWNNGANLVGNLFVSVILCGVVLSFFNV